MPLASRILPVALTLAACTAPAGAPSPPPTAPAPARLRSGVLAEHFDLSVNATDDFYHHVNGKWLANAVLPPDESDYGTFAEVADGAEARVRGLIERSAAQPGSDETSRKVGDFYASYMDERTLEARGIQPLEALLGKVRGTESRGEFWQLAGELLRIGVKAPLGVFVSPDRGDSSRYAAYVYQSGLGLPDRSYYLEEEARKATLRDAYVRHVERMLRLVANETPQESARRVVAWEAELAESQWTRVESMDRSRTYNVMTPDAMRALSPTAHWARFAKGAGLPEREVVLMQPSYFRALSTLTNQTPMATLCAYLEWQVVRAHASVMHAVMSDAHFAFYGKALRGKKEDSPRWQRAVDAIDAALGEAVGKLYVERHFGPAARARMLDLVGHLKSAFAERLQALDWMSEGTRKEALDKLAGMRVKIGHPDEFRNYDGLVVRRHELLENVQRAREFEHLRKIRKLSQSVDPDEWMLTPQTVNAYYSATRNEIVFPAAILTPPFFDVGADDAINYGAIGAVIGHEISHGFDDQGRKSDAKGNLRDWWAPRDAEEFAGRAEKLVQQFGSYEPLAGQRVDGQLTLGENIADLAGLRVAHAAYLRSLRGRPAPSIDGYTGEQRFFLGWAQIWRRKYRKAELERRLKVDSHAPAQYRVNAVLENLDAFHTAFGVTARDGMWRPPEQRSTIW